MSKRPRVTGADLVAVHSGEIIGPGLLLKILQIVTSTQRTWRSCSRSARGRWRLTGCCIGLIVVPGCIRMRTGFKAYKTCMGALS
jgi:hypothetical protein